MNNARNGQGHRKNKLTIILNFILFFETNGWWAPHGLLSRMTFDGAELRLKEKCSRYGINHYVNPNETQAERFSRHQHLEGDCAAECRRRDAERKRNARKHVSNETKQREAQRKREAYHKSEETKQHEAQRKREAYQKQSRGGTT